MVSGAYFSDEGRRNAGMHHRPPRPPSFVPVQPGVPLFWISYLWFPETKELYVTGNVVPSPAVGADQDSDIEIFVTLNGGSPTVLDCGPPPGNTVEFTGNPGDTYSITQVDENAVGDSLPSVALTGTIPTSPTPTTVPTTPGAPTIFFTP